MKKQKNRLDEMQEQKLLQIEHTGCWLAFYGMFAAIFVQIFLYGRDFERVAGGISGMIFFAIKYREYHMLWEAAASGVFISIFSFAIYFAGLSVVSYFHRERTKRLENAEEEDAENGEKQD